MCGLGCFVAFPLFGVSCFVCSVAQSWFVLSCAPCLFRFVFCLSRVVVMCALVCPSIGALNVQVAKQIVEQLLHVLQPKSNTGATMIGYCISR